MLLPEQSRIWFHTTTPTVKELQRNEFRETELVIPCILSPIELTSDSIQEVKVL